MIAEPACVLHLPEVRKRVSSIYALYTWPMAYKVVEVLRSFCAKNREKNIGLSFSSNRKHSMC